MHTKVTLALVLVSILLTTVRRADAEQVFSVDPDRIRQIAFEAVYERYPDIPVEKLLESRDGEHLVIWCMSAYKMGLVSDETEDFDQCYASLSFEIEDTINNNKYMDDDGLCFSEREAESFKVRVFHDGSVTVFPLGLGVGRVQKECTEEFEGWSK